MRVGHIDGGGPVTHSLAASNSSSVPAAAVAEGVSRNSSHHSLAVGPWDWQDQDGGFVDDGIMATGVIIAGVLLLVACFCSVHFLRRLGLCMGFHQRRPQSAVEEYREYRQQRLNEIFARYGGSGGSRRSQTHSGRALSRQGPRYMRLNGHPTVAQNGRREWGAPTQGVDVQRNPRSGRFTYIRFSPSGIRYTNQSILVPSSGVRRNQGDRRPILPPRGGTQPVDMQRGGSLVSAPLAYSSPWTASDSMMGSSLMSMGQSAETGNGMLDGVPMSVESRSEDLENGAQDMLDAVIESSDPQDVDPEQLEADDPSQQQKIYVDIPELFLCPITQDVMEDPVMAADGYTYERRAIMEWLKGHRRSPMTNEPMAEIVLIANHGLKSAIAEWRMGQ